VKPERLFRRIASGAVANVAFSDFRRLVEAFGFRHVRTTGSHLLFVHPDVRDSLNLQPRGGDVKPYQVRQFLRLVEDYNLQMERPS
jgi:predicted RNA binding protein YcfA (HicA-like mRNA interferase family)